MPTVKDTPPRRSRRRRPAVPADRPFSLDAFSVRAGTAFIPLVARARARVQFPELDFADEAAEDIAAALGVPADLFGTDPGWMRGIVCRARWFDARCRDFFAAHPDGLGIALGAGFDTRFRRLAGAARRWVDLDLPEVIAVKRQFVAPTGRYRMLDCDVTDLAWIDRTGWRPGTPAVLTAEGILMYLAPAEVRELFRGIAARFGEGGAPVAVLFDYASPVAAFNSWLHPALQHTEARFRSGLSGAEALRRIDMRFRVVEDRDVARECGPAAAVAAAMHELMTLGGHLHGLAHVELAAG